MVPGTCRLCLQDELLCNSHILPEFTYKPMYDKNSFMVMKADPNEGIQVKQKGLREYLLCQQCDNERLNRHETYMKAVFADGKYTRSHRRGEQIWIEGFDYAKCKLYHLSLLWRMSVSSRPFFSAVTLGPHEEKIRKCLIEDDPGEPEDYPFFAVLPTIDNEWFADYTHQPDSLRVGPHRVYRIVIAGILYLFGTNRGLVCGSRREWKDGLLKKDGSWMILTTEVEKIPYLNDWFSEHAKAQRIRRERRNKSR